MDSARSAIGPASALHPSTPTWNSLSDSPGGARAFRARLKSCDGFVIASSE
jgi:hypothetical protein